MPKRVTLELTPEQRQELVDCRDHHQLPYLRERAAALLLLADGLTLTHIAASRLLRPRDPDTVSSWLKRYQQEGLAGLAIRPGRGRNPAYFPAYPCSRNDCPCGEARSAPIRGQSDSASICPHYRSSSPHFI